MFVSSDSFAFDQSRGSVYIRCPVYKLNMAAFARLPERSIGKCGTFIYSDCFGDKPSRFIYRSKNLTAVWPSDVLQKLGAGY